MENKNTIKVIAIIILALIGAILLRTGYQKFFNIQDNKSTNSFNRETTTKKTTSNSTNNTNDITDTTTRLEESTTKKINSSTTSTVKKITNKINTTTKKITTTNNTTTTKTSTSSTTTKMSTTSSTTSTTTKIIVKDTSYQGFEFLQVMPEDKKVTYQEFQISSKKQLDRGVKGNNSQWPCQLETSRDGSVMLYGEDVSGLFKSTDHGKSWKRSNSGIDSPGVGMFAIDPYNTNHILALGLSTREYIGGIYISMDQAETWNRTCFNESETKTCNGTSSNGARYQYDGLEFDSTTYDSSLGITTDVYYSTPFLRDDDLRTNPNETFDVSETEYYKYMRLTTEDKQQEKKNKMGLYYSHDGGNNFELFIKDIRLSDGIVKILDNGSLYVGNEYGLFKIDKENKTIANSYLLNETDFTSHGITGLDYVGNIIYAQTWDGIYTLNDETGVLHKISNDETYHKVWPQSLTVSKTNPNHMMMTYRANPTNYYVTHAVYTMDGGATWNESEVDLDSTFYNVSWYAREKMFIIDPSDDRNVISIGSDYIMHSSDYGANFIQSSGLSHMMQGGKFNFNYHDPNVLFLSAQDYTGAVTTDKAKTFSNIVIKNYNNENVGNVYGGYAADDLTYYGFAKTTWCGGNLTITHDGGDTWIDTGLASNDDEVPKCSYYSSLQSINNPNVLFANEYYSKDRGYTWKKMDGCSSVFTYNYLNKHELYGTDKDANIVVSYDDGDTWTKISNTEWDSGLAKYGEHIIDLAYDHVNNVFYLVAMSYNSYDKSTRGDRTNIYKYDVNTHTKTKLDVPKDGKVGSMRYKTVAVDPNSTSVVYVGGAGDYFQTATALMRSIDGGNTWRVLTTANKSYIESWATNKGGYEISNLRVDPYTGYVLMSAGCNGYFLIDPPYDSSTLNHTKPSEHTIKYVFNGKVVKERKEKNNALHTYRLELDNYRFIGWYLDAELTIPVDEKLYIYNSMVLYAKMEPSKKITFHNNDTIIKVVDADKFNYSDDSLIPKREGYIFAGWYTDRSLNTKADFDNIDRSIDVYAGFYKVVDNIYNTDLKDCNTAITYLDHKVDSLGNFYDNTKRLNNRATLLDIKKNTSYFITLKMDNRFRLGFFETKWPSGYRSIDNYYIHPYDTNSKFDHVNANVSYLLNNENYVKLLLYYYTLNDDVNFMDVKNTIGVYELESTTLYL